MSAKTEKIETGGPAFPTETYQTDGMTLRDYFASKALLGIISGDLRMSIHETRQAIKAYEYADAMIQARKVSP